MHPESDPMNAALVLMHRTETVLGEMSATLLMVYRGSNVVDAENFDYGG